MNDRLAKLLARLRKGIRRSELVFEMVDDEQWEAVVYDNPYSWTVRDLLAHLVSAEGGLLRLSRDVVAGGPGAPRGFDYQAFNRLEQERLADVPATELWCRLTARREETVLWVQELEERDLDRMGRHPALGEITVEAFMNAIHGHQLMHVRDLSHSLR
jgi:hypothetical protein